LLHSNKAIRQTREVGVVISFLGVFNYLTDITTSSHCLDKTNKIKQHKQREHLLNCFQQKHRKTNDFKGSVTDRLRRIDIDQLRCFSSLNTL